jgi:sugar phosphate isomerase/epimerase
MTPFTEMVEAISDSFQCWEIICEGRHILPGIADNIRDAIDSYDFEFTVHAPFSDINIASLNPRIRDESIAQIVETLKICSDLGIDLVTLHPGYKSPLGAYFGDRIRETNKKSLARIDSVGAEYGVILALENIPRMWISLCSDAGEMMDLIEGTGLKVCFDVGHAHISGSVTEFLSLVHLFVNVHLHDNNGDHDRHLVLGEGSIDFPTLMLGLAGYTGNLVIESTNLEEGILSSNVLSGMLGK